MTSDYYIGIDGGTTGGVVVLYGSNGGIHVMQRFSMWRGMIDGNELGSFLVPFNHSYSQVTVAVEDCPKHAQSKSAMRSMAISFGIIMGVVRRELPTKRIITVRSGNPLDSWQRALLGTQPKGGTKPAALAKAREIWTDQVWPTKRPGGKAVHDGIVDAALIAWHARNIDMEKCTP